MSSYTPSTDGAYRTSDRDVRGHASWAMASGGVNPRPPARTRSASAPTMASTSTAAKSATSGRVDGFGREVAAAVGRDDAVAGTDREQRSRCWPASATRCAAARPGCDGGALVVGQGDREGGRRAGRQAGLDGRRGGGHGTGRRAARRDVAGPSRTRRGARARMAGRATRRRRDRIGHAGTSGLERAGGVAGHGTPLAIGHGSTEGCQGDRSTVLPTFLSKVRASTERVGDRTSAPRKGRSP